MKSETPSMQGIRVFITGGLGFIGSNLARRCLELGARVTIYDNLDPASGGRLHNIRGIEDDVEVHFHDIMNFDYLVDHIVGQEIIFNCAASTSHPFSMREPWRDLDVNSRAVVNLIEAVRRFNRGVKLVHIGTSTQLGRLVYQPADENHPEFPTDIYSANKSVSEKFVLIYARAYSIRATVIRLGNVFGPRASIHSPEFTFNNYFIGLALQDRDVTVFGDGSQLRNVLYVDDAVEALVAASLSPATDGETFFAVGDHHYSVSFIAEETVRAVGRGRVRHVPWPDERKTTEIGDAVISNGKIKKTLGWTPRVSFSEGLELTRDYYLDHLEHYLR
ncbi:MAG TPA: GDP-mannose 4,6-dehydratase [Syntrophales bacterium]|nr:GDP-mannose 4,6-dehydratase [Syntrophales bacterium]